MSDLTNVFVRDHKGEEFVGHVNLAGRRQPEIYFNERRGAILGGDRLGVKFCAKEGEGRPRSHPAKRVVMEMYLTPEGAEALGSALMTWVGELALKQRG